MACQGALLLTYNSSMRSFKRANTFWLGIAIQFAKDADSHRYHTKNATPERRNMLKRLWWCCLLRDRILPLGLRRPLYISASDFDCTVSPLKKEDFINEIGKSKVYNVPTKHSLIELFIMLCDLAASLTDVIVVIYPLQEPYERRSSDIDETEQAIHQVETCRAGLNRWFEKATLYFPTLAGLTDAHKSVVLYTNLMYMYYQYVWSFSSSVIFCHPQDSLTLQVLQS